MTLNNRLKYSPHVRGLRTLRSLIGVRPDKEGLRSSYGYVQHILKPKSKSVLFASFPASGWNWTVDVLSFVLCKHYTGQYEVKYEETGKTLKQAERKPIRLFYPADARAQESIFLPDVLPKCPTDHFYHTHGYYGESPLWGLESAKHVLIVRDFITALYSNFLKRKANYERFEDYLQKTNAVDRLVRFYNSWGAFCEKNPEQCFVLKYEDLKDDPAQYFEQTARFILNAKISSSIYQEAIDYYSFDNQKKRESLFARNETKHFHFKGQKSYKDLIDPKTYESLVDTLENNLKYKFGYDLSK
ncbi:MAG: sulfotransferase domain-containing protein [Alphaproteobacteria bacterium]